MNRKRGWYGLVLGLTVLCSGFVAAPGRAEERSGYLRYNVHVQDQLGKKGEHVFKASYTGWIDAQPPAFVLPAGSAVTVTGPRRGFVPSFVIVPKEAPKEIVFEYQEKHMGIGIEAYIERILAAEPVDLGKFGQLDRQGIREGKALPGMSKDGVLTALGIPPTHKTPTLDENRWTYWKDRFRTLVVEFDNGKVSNVRE